MDETKTYRVVGIRRNGTRAEMVAGLPLHGAVRAVMRLVEQQLFVGVLIEADTEPDHQSYGAPADRESFSSRGRNDRHEWSHSA